MFLAAADKPEGATQGDYVEFSWHRNKTGKPQALKVRRMTFIGVVKSYNINQGYGFIDSLAYNRMTTAQRLGPQSQQQGASRESVGALDEDDVFVHRDQMPSDIGQGDRVMFDVQINKQQAKAKRLIK